MDPVSLASQQQPLLVRTAPAPAALQVFQVFCARLARSRASTTDPADMDCQEASVEQMALLLISHLVVQGRNTGALGAHPHLAGGGGGGGGRIASKRAGLGARARLAAGPQSTGAKRAQAGWRGPRAPLPCRRAARGRPPAGPAVPAVPHPASLPQRAGRAAAGLCGRGAGWRGAAAARPPAARPPAAAARLASGGAARRRAWVRGSAWRIPLCHLQEGQRKRLAWARMVKVMQHNIATAPGAAGAGGAASRPELRA